MTGARALLCCALPALSALLAGCVDDQGRGAMHEAVSRCFATYTFSRGSAYNRFSCIAQAHQHFGPSAMGASYGLIAQVDQAALRVGLDLDSGALDQAGAQAALHWVTLKAQEQEQEAARLSAPP